MLLDQAKKNPSPHELVTDWYIPSEDPVMGYVYPGPVLISENTKLADIAARLRDKAMEKNTQEFVIKEEEWIYRGHRIETVNGVIFSLRRIPPEVPDINSLGLSGAAKAVLLHRKLCDGGFVLIAGEVGQGKTTTCAAVIKARLEKFGSFCLTVEDPPEMPLHGRHGKSGICIQTDVKSGQFAEALRGAVRCYPTKNSSILFVGEIRDSETAGEALRIATNGGLVIASMHGGDIVSSMKRLLSLAVNYKGMSDMEAKSVLSTAFRLMVHQKLKELPDGKKKLETKMLVSTGNTTPVAGNIREGRIDQLSTDIQQQEMLITNGQVDKLIGLWDVQGGVQNFKRGE